MFAASLRLSAITMLLFGVVFFIGVTPIAYDCSADRAVTQGQRGFDSPACERVAKLVGVSVRQTAPDHTLLRWWALPLPVTLFVVGVLEGLVMPAYARKPRAPSRAGTWYVLRQSGVHMTRIRAWRTVAGAYWLGWVIAIVLDARHWGFSAAALVDSWGGLLLGVGLLAMSVAVSSVRWFIAQPSLAVSRWPLVRGSEVTCRLAIPMRRRADLENVSIGIICQALWKNTHARQDFETSRREILGEYFAEEAGDDGVYRFEKTVKVPSDGAPAGAAYSRFRWFIEVHVNPVGAPGVDILYPVDVF